MTKHPINFLYRPLLYVLALALLLFVYLQAVPEAPFFGDESHWIHTSIYWEILQEEPVDSPFWDENYWTLTQPPVTRYLIGMARSIQGFTPDQLNNPWDFEISAAENRAVNNMPSQELLVASRIPMSILAALTGWVIFMMIFNGSGIVAALIFLLFFTSNQFLKITLVRAMGESPMLFFITLSSLFLWMGLRVLHTKAKGVSGTKFDGTAFLFFSLAGITCGLAGASKINGLMAAFSIALILLVYIWFFLPPGTPNQRIKLAIRIIFVISSATLLSFVLVNPFLYSNPLSGIGSMGKFRLQEMSLQINGFPEVHINSLSERASLLLNEVFSQFMPFQVPALITLLFVMLGITALFKRVQAFYFGRANLPNDLIPVLVLLPLALAGYATPLNWDRYLLPSVMVNMICAPIGMAYLLNSISDLIRKRKPARDLTTMQDG